jgi:hypothetical protein
LRSFESKELSAVVALYGIHSIWRGLKLIRHEFNPNPHRELGPRLGLVWLFEQVYLCDHKGNKSATYGWDGIIESAHSVNVS